MKKIIFLSLILFLLFGFTRGLVSGQGLTPVSFSGNDAFYVLEGNADLFFIDEQGRQSGYKNGHSIEEIPGVGTHIMIGGDNSNRKEIYMSKRKDLKLVIVGTINESYTLRIAGGNYHVILENVETKKNQIDEIISKEDSLFLDFDDNKEGFYNLRLNHRRYKNGSAHFQKVKITGEYQKYTIDWEGLNNKVANSIVFLTEKDTDGDENKYNIIFDEDKYGITDFIEQTENSEEKIIDSDGNILNFDESKNETVYYKEFTLIDKILIGVVLLSFIFVILLSNFLYKKKISKKYFYVSLLILMLVLSLIIFSNSKNYQNKKDFQNSTGALNSTNDYSNNESEVCNKTKEPGTEYDPKGRMGSYEIKDNKVYIRDYIGSTLNYDLKSTNMDAKTFKIVSSGYTRDAENIYFWGTKVDNVDLCSFEVSPFVDSRGYSNGFARDINYVFHRGRVLKKADAKTFIKIGPFFKDKNYVYNEYGEALIDVDVYTFVYNEKKYISYDKNGVYIDKDIMIKGADGQTFKKVGGYYYKDKNNVYFKTAIIEGADSETFEEISYEYSKDKNYIYYNGGKILKNIDVNTYSYIAQGSIIYDDNGVCPEPDICIEGADGKSFVDLRDGYYKDNNNAYYAIKYYKGGNYKYVINPIENINTSSFKKLSKYGYAKDEHNVYYLGLIIDNADVNSFTTIGGMSFAKDNNFVYYRGKVIENADSDSFKYLGGKLSVDKNNVYLGMEIIKNSDPEKCKNRKECSKNYLNK